MAASLAILIVQGSEDAALPVLRLLERGGYEVAWERVCSAAAMAQALDRRRWDLVIAGFAAPGFGATDVLGLLKERASDLPAVVISDARGEGIPRGAEPAGASVGAPLADVSRRLPMAERAPGDAGPRDGREACCTPRQSEERYRALVENMSDAVVCVRFDGVILYASPRVRELVGLEPTAVLGRHYREFVTPASASYIEELFASASREGSGRLHEVTVLRVDGSPVPVEASVAPLHDEDGGVVGAQAILRDASQRVSSEREVRAAHHRLLNIVEFLPDATFVIDAQRRVIAWNRAIEEMTGVPKRDIIGKGDHAYSVPFYGHQRPILIDLIGIDTPDVDIDYDYVHREGETVYGEMYVPSVYRGRGGYLWGIASPLYDETGRRVGAIESVRDVTARKLAEKALRESEERFRGLFDGIPACCYTFAPDGTILDWNRACTTAYGWQASEAVGRPMYDLFAAGLQAEAMQQSVAAVFRGESFEGIELEGLRADGETCYLLVNQYPLKDARGQVVMGICAGLDITAHKRLTEQLRHSQKMEAIGLLAGGIAHDFNNLLTVINGYSQFMVNSLEESDPLRQDAQEILAAGERAATMTRQLLAFSRRQVLEMRVLDLNDVLEGMGKMLPRLIGEHISLEVRLAPDLGYVRADPGQIEQVVINLVVNARDAMREGGTLVIETANAAWPGAPHVPQADPRDCGYVALSVRDTGCGMKPEVQEHLFEPFFTTKEPGAGTGLGLSTVYGIVRQSEGEIAVESAEGTGTTFTVYLPTVSESGESIELDAATRAPHGAETILLLEDQSEVRRLAGRMLRELGYSVIEATRGPEALERLRAIEETIDLVITDVVMPEMDGRSFVEALRSMRPEFRVLYMSGYNDDELLRRGVGSGEAPFVHKPFTVEELARKVREALDARGTP